MTDEPIVFDGTILTSGPITGVGRAFLDTLTAYVEIAEADCVLLAAREFSGEGIPDGVQIERVLPTRSRARRRATRRHTQRLGARVFHSPVVALPARMPCPTIATVHDVPWLYPELRGEPGTLWRQRIALALCVRRATRVIVPSQATHHDLKRATRINPGRVTVIPHGVPPVATPGDFDRSGPFLVLGDDRPRKNHARVKEAHARAKARCPDLPNLRFIGPPDDYVSEEEKHRLLASSPALIHCALLEGFGIPIVEAFAHGTPVICSNRTSLPEVAAGAALEVDPTDTAAIATVLIKLHTDPTLQQSLRARGLTRAAQLTPDRTAQSWKKIHTTRPI